MASRGRHQGVYQIRRAAPTKKTSDFVFVEVNAHETKQDKSERLSKVRSHLTTEFYKEQRAQRHRVFAVRAKSLRPKDEGEKEHPEPEADEETKHSAIENDMAVAVKSFSFSLFDPGSQPGLIRLDPFDVLPVKGDIRIDRTLQLWNSSPAPNLTPHTGLNSWGALAGSKHAWRFDYLTEDDQLMFYLRLMAASTWCDMLLDREISVETTFYRSQILRGLQESLRKQPGSLSTMIAISNMAIGSGVAGCLKEAEIHLAAVRRLVKLRGGFHKIPLAVRRVIFWNEFNAGAILQRGPKWPLDLIDDPSADPLPATLVESATARVQQTKRKFPPEVPCPETMFYYLHVLALTTTDFPQLSFNSGISNVFFKYMHGYYHAMTSERITNNKTDAFVMLRAMFLTSRLFLKSTLGHGGVHPIYSIWIRRMKGILLQGEGILLWVRSNGMNLLIWVLFVSAVLSENSESFYSWFIAQLGYSLAIQGICDYNGFLDVLTNFPWTAEFAQKSVKVWRESQESIHKILTPPFGLSQDSPELHSMRQEYCTRTQTLAAADWRAVPASDASSPNCSPDPSNGD